MMLKDRELLTIKQFLLDLKYGKDLIDSILSGDEDRNKDRDSINNGVNDGDRDDASTSDKRDKQDNTSG